MHSDVFASKARRTKTSVKVDAELMERVKAAGIDASRIAEAALNRALIEQDREQLRREIARDFRALEAFTDKHGDPGSELREMFGGFDAT
jgi:post-segregation antitoxin (ccd killing protein)